MCFKVWLWIDDVNKIATRSVLCLEELVEVGSRLVHCPELGIFADIPERVGPIRLLRHQVLLYLDEVHEHTTLPDASLESLRSNNNNISGLPFDPSSSGKITKWHYRWYLGYEARTFPPAPPRGSIRSRIRFPGSGGRDGGAVGGRSGAGEGSSRRDEGRGRTARQTRWDHAPSSAGAEGATGHGYDAGSTRRDGGEDLQIMAAAVVEENPRLRAHASTTGTWVGPLGEVAMTANGEGPVLPSEVGQPISSPSRENQKAGTQALFVEAALHIVGTLELSPVLHQMDCLPRDQHEARVVEEAAKEQGLNDLLLSCFWPLSPRGPASERPTLDSLSQILMEVVPVSSQGPNKEVGPKVLSNEAMVMLQGTGPDSSPVLTTSPPRPGLLHILDDIGVSASTKSFVNAISSPIQPSLCPPPATPVAKSTRSSIDSETSLRSARLASKPSIGLSTMDKMKMVLLKKNGIEVDAANPKDGLKKYNDIYKKKMMPEYIKVVAALVDATKTGKKGDAIKPLAATAVA
ncbi:hypothetical protein ACQ4PT_007336 [Festuca glaucescens]